MTFTLRRERNLKNGQDAGSFSGGALTAAYQNPFAAFAFMPMFQVFVFLQFLDALTTVGALQHGGYEANPIVNRMMGLGPVPGLVLAKLLVVVVAVGVLQRRRERALLIANYIYAGIVGWNLIALISAV